MAATDTQMQKLHEALAKVLTDQIEAQPGVDAEGITLPPSASILNVARQFLKDNGIESKAVPGSPLGKLMAAFPFEGDMSSPPLNPSSPGVSK
jgi:hypothetical protein